MRGDRRRRAAAVLAAHVLAACCACAATGGRGGGAEGARPPGASMREDGKGLTLCAGRFEFEAPAALAVAGRSQSIYRVDVASAPLPAGGLEEVRRERLAHVRALRPPAGVADPVRRSFELQPGVGAVWYYANPDDGEQLCLEAIKPSGGHAVVASRGGMAGDEEGVETLVGNVLDAYVPGAARGFCVGAGAVTSEPGVNEQVLVSLEHRSAPEFVVTFRTQTVNEPDTLTHSNLDEERRAVAARGGTLEVLRDGPRRAAGLEGKEVWVSVAAPGEPPFVRFAWHFPGAGGDSTRPAVTVVASARGANRAELEGAWESLLRSLRAFPPAG